MFNFNLFILAACCIQNNNELMQKYKNQNAKGSCTDRHIMLQFCGTCKIRNSFVAALQTMGREAVWQKSLLIFSPEDFPAHPFFQEKAVWSRILSIFNPCPHLALIPEFYFPTPGFLWFCLHDLFLLANHQFYLNLLHKKFFCFLYISVPKMLLALTVPFSMTHVLKSWNLVLP